jgi:formylglycine-generating enzyme required for sulfatase activity
VSWNDCQEWLKGLNAWITGQWPLWAGQHPALQQEVPHLALPSESLWEAACRARQVENESDPRADSFAFGATLDPSWANVDGNNTYGLGRKGIYRQRPVPIGFFGLVNCFGLADLHGQILEWCADQWHPNPLPEAQRQRHGWLGRGGKPEPEVLDGAALDGPDPGLAQAPLEQAMRLLRGGSWFPVPHYCRSASRISSLPDSRLHDAGFRVCCLPPGLLLYT